MTEMAMPISNKRKADKNWAMERGSEALFSCSFGLHVPLIQNRLRRSKSPAKVNKNFQPNNLTIFLVKTKWIRAKLNHCILTSILTKILDNFSRQNKVDIRTADPLHFDESFCSTIKFDNIPRQNSPFSRSSRIFSLNMLLYLE